MLYKPINAYPSNGVSIDAEKENVFSTIIQGASSVVTGYKAMFYDFDTLAQLEGFDIDGRVYLPWGRK